jgi:hypothetical protein
LNDWNHLARWVEQPKNPRLDNSPGTHRTSKRAVIAVSATSGRAGTQTASIAETTTLNLSTLLTHSIT